MKNRQSISEPNSRLYSHGYLSLKNCFFTKIFAKTTPLYQPNKVFNSQSLSGITFSLLLLAWYH